jgi:cobalt/nickel transport system permease protein
VLVVQALAFGDGGLTALGANLLNMALVAPLTALVAYRSLQSRGPLAAGFAAGWTSTVAAALACSAELALSGVGSIASLVGQHAVLGLVEGAVTAALVAATLPSIAVGRRTQIAALTVAAVVVCALTPLSSELPDTLEVVLAAVR